MGTISAVIQSMQNIGIDIPDEFADDIDLRDYVIDSIAFISFVLELEDALKIELPYEILIYDNLSSCKGFCAMLDDVVSEKQVAE
ncbi:MAG: acyl carrier protein [Lachnospiraceae bacterium]|nr:acyl carrier protein [Lachnospiraceae bacterium]